MSEIDKLFDNPEDAVSYLETLRIEYKLGYPDGHLRQMAVMGYVMHQRITELEGKLQRANQELVHYRGFVFSHPWMEYRARIQQDGEG